MKLKVTVNGYFEKHEGDLTVQDMLTALKGTGLLFTGSIEGTCGSINKPIKQYVKAVVVKHES